MLYHRQQMEIKIKSLEAICELQSEKISRIQAQFDIALSQMITVLQNPTSVDVDEDIGIDDVDQSQL